MIKESFFSQDNVLSDEKFDTAPIVNKLVGQLQGSSILKIAYETQALISNGIRIANFTIGDFDPQTFRIPTELENQIHLAYQNGETTYPPSMGVTSLRESVALYYKNDLNIPFSAHNIIIASGVRPAIYATFMSIVEPGENVIYCAPSWNTENYVKLAGGTPQRIVTESKNNFFPNISDIVPHISNAALIAICSPNNPTGAVISQEQLSDICELILNENKLRKLYNRKPLYLLFDQVYWKYISPQHEHYHPIMINAQMKEYTIYTDGMSKSFAATGLRIGWAAGPQNVISNISNLIAFMGAWAPKPEQIASAHYLENQEYRKEYIKKNEAIIFNRLNVVYESIQSMKAEGLPIDCVKPQGGMFLSIQIPIINKNITDYGFITDPNDLRRFILMVGKCSFIPFDCFNNPENADWLRASISSLSDEDIKFGLENLRLALQKVEL